MQGWTPAAIQVLDDDKYFTHYERSALERSNETEETNPLTGIQG